MDEKLSFNRITPSVLVYVELESDNGGMLLSASEDGFCFRAVTPLKPSGPVAFAILLGAKQRLEGKGKLVWSEEEGRKGGILFTEVTPQFRREFETWLHRKEGRGSSPLEAKTDIRHVPPAPEEPKTPAPKPAEKPASKVVEMPPKPVQPAPKSPQKEKREEESTPAVQLDDLERALRKQQPRVEPAKPPKSAPEPPSVAAADPAVVQSAPQQRIEEPPRKISPPAPEIPAPPAVSTFEKISQGIRLETPVERKATEPPAMTLKLPVQAESDTWTGLPRISGKPPAPTPASPPQEPPQQIRTEPKAAEVSRVEEAPPPVAASEPGTLERSKSELSSEVVEEPVSSVPGSAMQEPQEPVLQEPLPQEQVPEETTQERAPERVVESIEEPFAPALAIPAENSPAAEPAEASHADLMGRIGIAPSHVFDTAYSESEAEPRHGIGAVYKTLIVLIVLGVLAIVAVQYRRPLGEAIIRLGQMIAGEPGSTEAQPQSSPQSAAPNSATQPSAAPSGQDAANATNDSGQPPASSANNSAAASSSPSTSPSAATDNSSENAANESGNSPVTQPASKSGNGRAEFDEARKLLHGDHRKRDMSKAVQLLKVGVSHGYPPAEVTLGDLYARGDGVPKDCAQARTLLQSGAKSGSPEARRMLAKLKSEGCP